jgi:transposase
VALERCEEKRAAFREQIAGVAWEKLVFLDECGFGLNLHRLYGWTIGGGRCVEAVPFERGQNRSCLGAFSLPTPSCPTGMRVLWQKSGAWTRASFEAFLQDGLLPVLAPDSVLVLDNASIHRGGAIAELVEAAGCSLLYLPPYSPDLNPIELVWSFVKHRVRTLAPRDDATRQSTIQDAARQLPPSAATAWFKHCGLKPPD